MHWDCRVGSAWDPMNLAGLSRSEQPSDIVVCVWENRVGVTCGPSPYHIHSRAAFSLKVAVT